MIRFDSVISEALRICARTPGFTECARACLVRDVHGIVRVAIDPAPDSIAPLDIAKLEDALSAALEGYYSRPVVSTSGDGDVCRLAKKLFEIAETWDSPCYSDPVRGVEVQVESPPMFRIERRMTRHSWLSKAAVGTAPPWPLREQTPAVVSFFSFKGGVGRTTALIATAWQLAQRGKSVVMVDLDLEAPGLGPTLGITGTRGALDFLVDYLSTGSNRLDDLTVQVSVFGAENHRINLIPAGNLDEHYLEKLARLDFGIPLSASAPTVLTAFRELLKAINRAYEPDYILLDARAGLHDLGGISLNGLSHVDVIVSRASKQSYAGLGLTIEMLARRKQSDLSVIITHAFAPTARGSEVERAEIAEMLDESYGMYKAHVYDSSLYEDIDVPAREDTSAPHHPIVLHENAALRAIADVSAVRDEMLGQDYSNLVDRIEELATPEQDVEEDE